MIINLLAQVAESLKKTNRVRLFGSGGPGEPARKRRDRRLSLADQHDPEALKQLREALTLRPDTNVMDWMQPPDLWFELIGRDGTPLTAIGLLVPGWIRWQSEGDVELQDPPAITHWLTRWAPSAATVITERRARKT